MDPYDDQKHLGPRGMTNEEIFSELRSALSRQGPSSPGSQSFAEWFHQQLESELEMSSDLEAALRAAIERSGMSLNSIANQSGVDQSALSRFMRSERTLTLETGSKIAAILGMELVEKTEKPTKKTKPTKKSKK